MTDDTEGDEILAAAKIPVAVVGAAIALAVCALFTGLVGLQNLLLIRWLFPYALIPWVQLGLAGGGIYVASKLYRARAWSLPVGLVLASLMALGMIAFVVLSLMSGVLSLMAILGVPSAMAALVFGGASLKPFRELVERRKKLKLSGYDLDF